MPHTAIRSSLDLLVEAESHYDKYYIFSALDAYKQHLDCFAHPRGKLLFNTSSIYLDLGFLTAAIESLKQALQADPHLAVANYQLAGLLLHQGDRGGAEAAYVGALESMCEGDTDYEIVGMKFTLRIAAVKHGLAFCRGASNTLGPAMVPSGVIFRVEDRKARARTQDVAKTAEWRFRQDSRVLAVCEEEGPDKGRRSRVRGWFGRLFKKAGKGSEGRGGPYTSTG